MELTINEQSVTARAGESVLQCALRHNIEIPHLCTHPHLPAFGACRMCVVEIDGMRGFPASCTTPATDGMVVRTHTETLQTLRRGILELILLEHPSACLLCDKQELCEQFRPSASVHAGMQHAGLYPLFQDRQADHEELVQIRPKDRQEVGSLQQRIPLILGFV